MTVSIEQQKALFDQAIGIANAEERHEFLRQACHDNHAQREELERLVEDHFRAGSFLNRELFPSSASTTNDPESEFPQIDRYKIREKIGEGGMGIVYAAEQSEPVRRKVAIKVIKPGMDSREVIARFESERQALAVMEHPNIARILDAGLTQSGRSYFAMELVRGIPITTYCDEAKFSQHDRISLFKDVCRAVHHAHQKGVIHRDVKPSNVLVTLIDGQPVVKIIDFGLAKATGPRDLSDKSVYTQFLRFMGTPAYMSPEQAGLSGVDIDTRSDIYSLGVLLYQLLTGRTPLSAEDCANESYEVLRKRIREIDAPKPSHCVSTLNNAERTTVAAKRRVEPKLLVRQLQGDLDWIVLKALEKDRNRRYESAAALADDIDRHLAGNPVSAAAPSRTYVLAKFVKRYRVVLTTAALFLILLVTATCISSVLAVQANQQASRAEKAVRNTQDALDLAQKNEIAAIDAKNVATTLRQNVEAERDRLVGLNYANTMMRCRLEIESSHFVEAQRLLDQTADYPDRGFEWYHLQRRLHPENIEVLTEDNMYATPQKVAYSPAGNRVAFCEELSQRVRILNVNARVPEEEPALYCDGSPIKVVFSHHGDRIAVVVVPTDGSPVWVSVYDSRSHELIQRLPHHFRPDRWGGDVNLAVGLDFSPASNILATVDHMPEDKGIRARIWEVDSCEVIQELHIPEGPYRARMRFSPDGQRIAVTSSASTISVIDLATEMTIATIPGDGFPSFSSDGKRLATVGGGKGLIVEIDDPDDVKYLESEGRLENLNFSPDGQWIAGSTPKSTQVWRADTLELVKTLPAPLADIAFSPTGLSLATLGDTFKIWEISDSLPVDEVVSNKNPHGMMNSVAWAPDNVHLLFGARGGPVEIWNTQTGGIEVFKDDKGEEHEATAVDWSSDGAMIAIAVRVLTPNSKQDEDEWIRFVRIYDAKSRQLLKTVLNHDALCLDVQFSPDNKRIAARFDDGALLIWDTLSWNVKTIVDTDPSSIQRRKSSFSFSPDSQELAVGRSGPRVEYFDVETGKLTRSHALERIVSSSRLSEEWAGSIASVVLNIDHSPDGSSVVATLFERADVLDCQTGERRCRIDTLSDWIASFTPDGRVMVGYFQNPAGTLRLYDATYGTELCRFDDVERLDGTVAAFSPDGEQLFVGSRARLGGIRRAMPKAEYQRRLAIQHSSPPNDKPRAPSGSFP